VGSVGWTCSRGNWSAPFGGCWRHTRRCAGPPVATLANGLANWTALAYKTWSDGDVVQLGCKVRGTHGGPAARVRWKAASVVPSPAAWPPLP
jgi:hypothetical protein